MGKYFYKAFKRLQKKHFLDAKLQFKKKQDISNHCFLPWPFAWKAKPWSWRLLFLPLISQFWEVAWEQTRTTMSAKVCNWNRVVDFLTTFSQLSHSFLTAFWQLSHNFFTTFSPLSHNFLTTFSQLSHNFLHNFFTTFQNFLISVCTFLDNLNFFNRHLIFWLGLYPFGPCFFFYCKIH